MLCDMRYRDYLAWEGWLAIGLGLELALVAFPGLLLSCLLYTSPSPRDS